jgi:hypothetical protein
MLSQGQPLLTQILLCARGFTKPSSTIQRMKVLCRFVCLDMLLSGWQQFDRDQIPAGRRLELSSQHNATPVPFYQSIRT